MGKYFGALKDHKNLLLLPTVLGLIAVITLISLYLLKAKNDLSPTDQNALSECISAEINLNYPSYKTGEIIVRAKDEDASISSASLNKYSTQRDIIIEEVRDKTYLITSNKLEVAVKRNYSDCEYQIGEKIDYYTQAMIDSVENDPDVENAQPNYLSTIFELNDPYFLDNYPDNTIYRDPVWDPKYDYLWNLKLIDLERAKDIEGENEVVIAVIDTGVDSNHPELNGRMWNNPNEILNGIDDDGNGYIDDLYGWNFVADSPNISDDNGHGTAVAGVMAANSNNSLGISGISSTAKIMPIKAFNSNGSGDDYAILQAFKYAVDNGADIINASFGGRGQNKLFEEILTQAYEKNIITVAGAGNLSGDVGDFYPANINCSKSDNSINDCVISVGAVDHRDSLSSYSNFGNKLDVSAPGGASEYNLLSLKSSVHRDFMTAHIVGGNYLKVTGTSFATPHVSGLAAMILSKNPNLSSLEVRNIILNGTEDKGEKGFDTKYGFGRINAFKTLKEMNTNTPSIVNIQYPGDGMPSSTDFWLKGSVSLQGFKKYKIELKEENASSWTTENVQIPDNTKEQRFGSLGRITIPNLKKPTNFTLRLTAEGSSTPLSVESTFRADPRITSIFPINLSIQNKDSFTNNPLIADIDGDGKQDIVVHNSNDHKLYAYNHDGNIKNGWPVDIIEDMDSPEPVAPIALDMDPEVAGLEIFTVTKNDSGNLIGFHANGSQAFNFRINSSINQGRLGWVTAEGSLSAGTKNGENVIIFADYESKNGILSLHAINRYGSELQGFPIQLDERLTHPIIVSNLNEEPNSEILVQFKDNITVYSLDGTEVTGTEIVQLESIEGEISKLTVGDINVDKINDIVLVANEENFTKIHVIDVEGNSIEAGWPSTINDPHSKITSIQLVNLDEDLSLEVIASDGEKSYILDHDGTIIATEEMGFGENSSSINLNNALLFYDSHKSSLQTKTIQQNTSHIVSLDTAGFSNELGFPSVYDLNNDNKAELVFVAVDKNKNQLLYKIDLDQQFESYNWPLYLYNAQHVNALEYKPKIDPTTKPTYSPTPMPSPTIEPSENPIVTDTPKVSPPFTGKSMECVSKLAIRGKGTLLETAKPGEEFKYIINFKPGSDISGIVTDYLPHSLELLEYDKTICDTSDQVLGLSTNLIAPVKISLAIFGITVIIVSFWFIKRKKGTDNRNHFKKQVVVVMGFLASVTMLQIFYNSYNSTDNAPTDTSAATQKIVMCEIPAGTTSLSLSVKVKNEAKGMVLNSAEVISGGKKTTCEHKLGIEIEPKEELESVVCGPIDINGDNTLTISDFADDQNGFSRKYYRECSDATTAYRGCGGKDVNGDGRIDIKDFAGNIGFVKRYMKNDCR